MVAVVNHAVQQIKVKRNAGGNMT